MFAQVFGTCTFGLNGHVITVEVDISRASPAFDIVGLPAVSVKESKERVQSAIRNSGYFFSYRKGDSEFGACGFEEGRFLS